MKKGFFFSLAAALMLCFGACNPDDTTTNNNGNGNGDSNSLVGNWKVDNMTYNGQEMTPPDMVLVMNANGTGDVLMNGQSENDNFTWSVNGNVLTVHPNGGGEYSFTIVSISATEASLTGNVVPGTDMQGDVTMHLTKINGGGGDNPPSGDFPAGTIWNYEYDTTMVDPESGAAYVIVIQMRLHFNTETQGVMTLFYKMTANGQTIDSFSEDSPFTYTYNSATNSGTMSVTVTDEETGETETNIMQFRYDPSANTITVINPDPDPDDPMGSVVVFTRVNK